VSIRPEIQLAPSSEPQERNWLPLAIAAGVVLILAIAVVLFPGFGNSKSSSSSSATAAPDAYAANLPLTNLVMSESANLAGGKMTYVDGHIANRGLRTITAVTVQVIFHNAAGEVAYNQNQPLKLIRTRDPYIDVEPVSAASLKPGDEHDFRLIFDSVPQDWDGAYPQLRILHVEAK
jgi:hypothetical protein